MTAMGSTSFGRIVEPLGGTGDVTRMAKGGHAKPKQPKHHVTIVIAPPHPAHQIMGALAMAALVEHARREAARQHMARGGR